jgi:hypothetical protein
MAIGGFKSWLAQLEDGSDTYLTVAELLAVLTLALSVMALSILTLVWIFTGCGLQMKEQRLADVLATLNSNWKAVLILLIPLFYRTIRRFIARIRKGPLGMEADPEEEAAKLETQVLEKNPPEGGQT